MNNFKSLIPPEVREAMEKFGCSERRGRLTDEDLRILQVSEKRLPRISWASLIIIGAFQITQETERQFCRENEEILTIVSFEGRARW